MICLKRGEKLVCYDKKIKENCNGEALTSQGILKNIKEVKKILKIQVNQKTAIKIAKEKIKNAWGKEDIIKEYIKTYDDIKKIKNILGKRIRDFTEMYWPEITDRSNDEIVDKLSENRKTEMGGNFDEQDLSGFFLTVEQYKSFSNYESKLKKEIETLMHNFPNFSYLATPLIAARLINAAGSAIKLASSTASTIQILGAERSMFLHLKTGSKPPKYGFIFEHPLIQKAKDRGKTARKLANKLSLMLKKDVFGDKEFVADKIEEELEKEITTK